MLIQLLLALKRLLRALGPVLVGCIFLGAVYLLYREISKYSLADIRMSLAQISTGSIILSVLLAIINYIILIGYDWLALKGIHKTLPVSRVSLVSFVGQAVSYNFGALLGGSTVRFRFYSSWGFSPMDIVRLVLMLAITFWVGALGLVGAIFMIAPPEIPPELGMHMPLDIRPLGAILFLIAISYLIVCKFNHKPIHIFGKEFAFPPFKIAVAQAVVAGADLVAAGACLYVLLPPDAHVSFLQFLPTYLMAMVAVVLTHVPGGAGVLEVVILHLTTASPQAVFAALLCFRVIYYLLPLLLDKREPDEEYLALLPRQLGLTALQPRQPPQLSGGQQQRAAIARALITRPAVVLADEPTGNLDHQNSVEVFRLLREAAAQQHQTVVYVTHDQGLAAQADRVLRMQDGRIEEA